MNVGGGPDLLRGLALAALSVLLTAAGHLAGGGELPDLGLLLVLLPLLAGVFSTVAGRRGVLGALLALGAGQLVLHHLLELWHPSHHAGPPTGLAMPAAHLAVTLLTAVAVRHAERGIAGLVAALRRIRPRRLPARPAERPLATRIVPAGDVPARRARLLAVADVRRGPPVGR